MPTQPHSPAPWTANGTRVSAADGSEVTDICPQQDSTLFDANRHLITAAPLMLEALKAVRDHHFTRITIAIENTITTAIDAAEGR